jgi:hypothetical protein
MPYYEVANLVTVTKMNMINQMPCTYGTLIATAVRIRHRVSHRAVQRSQLLSQSPTDLHESSLLLQKLTIVQVISRSILNAPPYQQKLSGAPENSLAESECSFLSSRVVWKHLGVLRSTGNVNCSVWEVRLWLPD